MGGRFNDTQDPPMMEAECQKIISIWLIYKRIFSSFENIFVSEVFVDYVFHLVFTKNIHENSVGKNFGGARVFELSLATTITVLKPVSCDHVTSFNYDGKKARDVGLTCWCHLSNIMPDGIFHESMRQGITWFLLLFFFVCLFCFLEVILLFSSG